MPGRLETTLKEGRFAVTAEMGPPTGADKSPILEKCRYFRGFVDAVNVTDNQAAVVRMSSLMVSSFLVQEGLEPVMQLTCRDRNRLALQSEILSAAAAGITNVLCLTGDHQSVGNQPEAKGVFDLDSTQLVHMVDQMNSGFLMNGQPVNPPPTMFVGATANPFAEPLQMRVWNLAKKINAGARFIQTQPVFDIPRFEKWMQALHDEGLDEQVFILAGATPPKSAESIRYMREKVPGMRVADEYMSRMESATDPKETGVEICLEIIAQLRQIRGVRGVHLMPVKWESIVPTLVEEAGLSRDQVAGAMPEARR